MDSWQKDVLDIIKPSPTRLFVCFLLSTSFYILRFWNIMSLRLTDNDMPLKQLIESKNLEVAEIFNNPIFYKLWLAVLWALIAFAVYSLIWVITNGFIEASNEYILATKYTHVNDPKHTHIKHLFIKILFIITLVLFVILSWRKLFPYWQNIVQKFFTSPINNTLDFLPLLAGILGSALTIYIIWSLAHIARKIV